MTMLEAIQAGFARLETLFKSRADLETQLADAQKSASEANARLKGNESGTAALHGLIKEHETKLAADVELLGAKDAEIASLKKNISDLQAAAKTSAEQAAAITAAQGISATKLPTGEATPAADVVALRAQLATSTNPKEKYMLSMAIKELLAKQKKA